MKTLFVLLCTISLPLVSQIDFDGFRVITLGAGIMQTTHQGFYSVQRVRASSFSVENITVERPHEKAGVINPEFKLYGGNDTRCGQVNFAGVLQLLSLACDPKNIDIERLAGGKFQKIMSTPTKGINADNFPTDVSVDKRFWCYDFIDVTYTAGNNNLKFGFDFGWKGIGFSFPGTTLTNTGKTLLYSFEDTHEDNLIRFKLGPAISYHKNLGSNLALLTFAGCNYLPNIFSAGQYKRKLVNPFINLAVFIGKQKGVALSCSYNYLSGKNKHMLSETRYFVGSSKAVETEQIYADTKLKVTQFETKLCFYINKD